MLTPEQKSAYLNNGADFCPHCESANIDSVDGSAPDWTYNLLVVQCTDCKAKWVLTYRLSEIADPQEDK